MAPPSSAAADRFTALEKDPFPPTAPFGTPTLDTYPVRIETKPAPSAAKAQKLLWTSKTGYVALKCACLAREDNVRYCMGMKIIFRNPGPPLAGPARAWSHREA